MSKTLTEQVAALDARVDLLYTRLGIDAEAIEADRAASLEAGALAAGLEDVDAAPAQ